MTDTPGLDPDELAAWKSFVAMHHRLERHLNQHLQREYGLSGPDFEVLVNLSEASERTMPVSTLAAVTQWEKSRLSRHLHRMEQRGLVRRDAAHPRRHQVTLTDEGFAAITTSAPANAARVRELFVDVIGPRRLSEVEETARTVLAALDDHVTRDCAVAKD